MPHCDCAPPATGGGYFSWAQITGDVDAAARWVNAVRPVGITLLLVILVVFPVQAGLGPDYTPPPGMVDPQVTQSNIASTICMPGYTGTVRPPVKYTNGLKQTQMDARRYTDTDPRDYEEDHWIPLEIGGHPTNPQNLWPQPYANVGPAGAAKVKDTLENALHTAVCGRKMTLHDAQACLLNQPTWVACARRMHTRTPEPSPSTS